MPWTPKDLLDDIIRAAAKADHPTGDGGCGCGNLLCETCGNPAQRTFWIMEVYTQCRGCKGTPPAHLPNGVCVWCNGAGKEWLAVHPTKGEVYCYDTQQEAATMLRMCYPDALRDARLGDTPEVRVTQCCSPYVADGDMRILRVVDGTAVR